jgi:hypothetical protein
MFLRRSPIVAYLRRSVYDYKWATVVWQSTESRATGWKMREGGMEPCTMAKPVFIENTSNFGSYSLPWLRMNDCVIVDI